MIHVPARDYADGAFGFLTTQALQYGDASSRDANSGGAAVQSIVAFESRGDAQEVQWLWDSWPEAGAGRNRYVPLSAVSEDNLVSWRMPPVAGDRCKSSASTEQAKAVTRPHCLGRLAVVVYTLY